MDELSAEQLRDVAAINARVYAMNDEERAQWYAEHPVSMFEPHQHVHEVNALIPDVTRFEVIDHRSSLRWDAIRRSAVFHGVKVELSLQDDGQTLKVFVDDRE